MKFRCSNCSYVFSVELGGGSAAANRPAVSTGEPPSRLGNRVAKVSPGEPVRLLQTQGVIYEVPDLAMLQRWILEQRVVRSDLLSLHGLRWQQAGDRQDLETFFNAAEALHAGGGARRRDRTNLGRDLDVVPMDEGLGDGTTDPTEVEGIDAPERAVDDRGGRATHSDTPEVSSVDLQPLGRSTPKITSRPRPRPGQELGPVLPPLMANPDDVDIGTIPAPSADTEVDISGRMPARAAAPPPPPPPRPDLGPSPVMTATPLVLPPVEYGAPDRRPEVEDVDPDGGAPFMLRVLMMGAAVFAAIVVIGIVGYLYFGRDAAPPPEPVVVTEIGGDPPTIEPAPTPPDPTAATTTATDPTSAAGTGSSVAPPVPAPVAPAAPALPETAAPPPTKPASATASPATKSTKPPSQPSGGSLTKQGWNAVNGNDYKKAYDFFDRAVQQRSNSAEALYGRGYASEKLGDKTSAKSDYCSSLSGSGASDVAAEVNGRLRALGLSCS